MTSSARHSACSGLCIRTLLLVSPAIWFHPLSVRLPLSARLPLLPGAYGLIDALEAEAGPAAAACFCHFDLLPDNLVRDGSRVWLIDCEYAAAGQPLMDLAIMSMGCALSGEEETALLRRMRELAARRAAAAV